MTRLLTLNTQNMKIPSYFRRNKNKQKVKNRSSADDHGSIGPKEILQKAPKIGRAEISEDNNTTKSEFVLSSATIPTESPKSEVADSEHYWRSPLQAGNETSHVLWNRAYENLKCSETTAELVDVYEKILTASLQHGTSSNSGTAVSGGQPDLALEITLTNNAPNIFACDESQRMVHMRRVTQLALTRAERNANVNLAVSEALRVITAIQGVVGTMLSAYSPASLAWSGICVILPVIASPSVQSMALKDGLHFVTEKLGWYLAISECSFKEILPASPAELLHLQNLTESKILDLIQSFLEFEMKSVCFHFGNHALVRALKAILAIDDWKARIGYLKGLESEIKDCMSQFYDASNTLRLVKMSENTSQISMILRELDLMRQLQLDGNRRLTESQRLELVSKFSTKTTCPYVERMKSVPKRVEGTCNWFRAHDRYNAWIKSAYGGLLLLSADPGCGKSVLSRFLIEDVIPERRPDDILCYFFFKDSPDQNNICAALSALIHQILSRYPEFSDLVQTEISSNGTALTSKESTLWNIFKRIIDRKTLRMNVTFVLDALDECQRSDRITLVDRIKDLIDDNSNVAQNRTEPTTRKIRFLITTRGYPDIIALFNNFSQGLIHLAGENKKEVDEIQAEISMVVDFRLNQLAMGKNLREDRKKMLRKRLIEKGGEQRTYLWVRLVFEVLEANLRDQQFVWNRLVNTVPQSAHSAYEKLLARVRQDERDRVEMLFKMMIVALRPLSVQTAALLLDVRDFVDNENEFLNSYGIESGEKIDLESTESFKAWIIGTCGIFVTIYDENLFFLHQTAKEFLLAPGDVARRDSHEFRHSITEREAHKVMAENCLLLWKYGRFAGNEESHRYCLTYTAHHFCEAQSFTGNGDCAVQDIDDRFWDIYANSWNDLEFIRNQSVSSFLRQHDRYVLDSDDTEQIKLACMATFGHYRLLDQTLQNSRVSGRILDPLDTPWMLPDTVAATHCANLLLNYLPQRPPLLFTQYDT
ncbi:uncharacterized protein N7479_006062 [Penicillium vulpinum]|uniref:NWD NACHT-NTPase N-terminal domain-containing protein n=1 Tax=Penicillium vulpinum TaxID=29845 RepID=A0A1V6SEJ9_9EURO|nr:uncharacterized protein N7479_006062 [Penicillium vulpinum]KAJ5958912.1 hypothetical protein N7479_006062 [Penicillium vulpinum]OQE12425.1 hypothetical protein PENVUL_c001G02122 [Penicillium vulpinum]